MATGWMPYDATKLGHLGYGKYKNVVTNIEFEAMAKKGAITRPSDGKDANKSSIYSVRGKQGPESSSLLFFHVLCDIVKAGEVCEAESRGIGNDSL